VLAMQPLPPDIDRVLIDFLRDNQLVESNALETLKNKPGEYGLVYRLLELKQLDEARIAEKMAHIYGFEQINITPAMIDARPFTDKVTTAYILKKRVIPIQLDGVVLTVAIADPAGLRHVSELKLMTGKSIRTVICLLSTFDQVQEVKPASSVIIPLSKKSEPDKMRAEAAGSDVVDFVNHVINEAISQGVSDIHIEAFRDEARVRFRLHGLLEEQSHFAEFLTFNYSAVTTRIKILASLDISERRLPQDGAIAKEITDRVVDIRVSVLPTANGERIVMRVLDQSNANIKLSSLGLSEKIYDQVQKAIHAPQGMILVTGPTGSGKSTTLYAILKELNQPGVNILTAEDPVEYALSGIAQVQVRDDIGLTFAAALRSFLRQDPEVIMVGEIRDKETSDIAIKAALTGHMVLSTLHTNDAPSTITRLINMGVPAYLITAALSMVIAQRLARTLCQQCKHEVNITDEEWLALGFAPETLTSKKAYQADGCDACSHTGIEGRRAIHEVLSITPTMRDTIMQGASDNDMKALASKEGFLSMQEIGRDLITKGTLSIAEYKRILVL
jgi:type IV pilus assembly protein PilB